MLNLLFCLNVTLCFQSLCTEYGSACCTADRVVRQTDEFPVVNGTVYDWKFVGLSHNTVRGAAGGAVLCAETLKAKGYIQAK